MAGRERGEWKPPKPDLFQGRPYVLTPGSQAELETPQARDFIAWIERIGAFTVILTSGRTRSHRWPTPRICRNLRPLRLAALLENRAEPKSGVFGPALVDSTRLALSSFDIWGDILATNREADPEALRSYIAKLEEFCGEFWRPNAMREHFDRASKFATGSGIMRESVP